MSMTTNREETKILNLALFEKLASCDLVQRQALILGYSELSFNLASSI